METDPNKAPRQCVSGPRGERRFKAKYQRVTDIPDRLLKDPNLEIYECDHCGYMHLGHEVVDSERRNKAVLHVFPTGQRWVYSYRESAVGSRSVR